MRALLREPFALSGLDLAFDRPVAARLAVQPRRHACGGDCGGGRADAARLRSQMSVDETDRHLSAYRHFFIAKAACRDIPVVSLAPRFVAGSSVAT
jgi:hypothetical protein